jgi:hypothetical protein
MTRIKIYCQSPFSAYAGNSADRPPPLTFLSQISASLDTFGSTAVIGGRARILLPARKFWNTYFYPSSRIGGVSIVCQIRPPTSPSFPFFLQVETKSVTRARLQQLGAERAHRSHLRAPSRYVYSGTTGHVQISPLLPTPVISARSLETGKG